MDRRLRLLVSLLGALVITAGILDGWKWGDMAAFVVHTALGGSLLLCVVASRSIPNLARIVALAVAGVAAGFEGVRLVTKAATPPAVPVAAMALVMVLLLRVPSKRREESSPPPG